MRDRVPPPTTAVHGVSTEPRAGCPRRVATAASRSPGMHAAPSASLHSRMVAATASPWPHRIQQAPARRQADTPAAPSGAARFERRPWTRGQPRTVGNLESHTRAASFEVARREGEGARDGDTGVDAPSGHEANGARERRREAQLFAGGAGAGLWAGWFFRASRSFAKRGSICGSVRARSAIAARSASRPRQRASSATSCASAAENVDAIVKRCLVYGCVVIAQLSAIFGIAIAHIWRLFRGNSASCTGADGATIASLPGEWRVVLAMASGRMAITGRCPSRG